MSQGSGNIGGALRDISENLGSIYRFFLPGVLIVGVTFVAYPTKISWPKSSDPWELLVLGIVALAAGNTLFVFNRYSVHQIIDWLLYRLGCDGPAKRNPKLAESRDYVDALGRFVTDSNLISDEMKALRHHVQFRASSVLLMYTVCELAIVFSLWNEGPGNFLHDNAWLIRIVGLLAFSVAIWQTLITRRIDWYTVYPPKRDDKPAPSTSR